MKNSTTKKVLLAEVKKMESKYLDLVWYARSSPKNNSIQGVLENRIRIEKTYPDEVAKLQSRADSGWSHGFNSGMLAGMRYVMDLLTEGIEEAEDLFPDLDS